MKINEIYTRQHKSGEKPYQSMPDYETVKSYIKRDGMYIVHIQPDMITQELANLAIINNPDPAIGEFFEYIPEKFRTVKLCDAAVKNDWMSYPYVPENIRKARDIEYGYIMALQSYKTLGWFEPNERREIYTRIRRENPDYWSKMSKRLKWMEENFWNK